MNGGQHGKRYNKKLFVHDKFVDVSLTGLPNVAGPA